jgi:uncharacterized membrane protein
VVPVTHDAQALDEPDLLEADDVEAAEAAVRAETAARRVRRLGRAVPWVLIVGGALGLLAAFQLTLDKVRILADPDYNPSCNINPVLSCGSVIVTEQASVFGFPNPIMGLVGFSVVITIGVLLASRVVLPRWVWLGLNVGALAGVVFVHWLVYQSLYSIGALCPWCMVVWAVTLPIFVYVTAANLATGRLPAPRGLGESIALLRNWILAGWYLVITGLIFVRWQDFWLGGV